MDKSEKKFHVFHIFIVYILAYMHEGCYTFYHTNISVRYFIDNVVIS